MRSNAGRRTRLRAPRRWASRGAAVLVEWLLQLHALVFLAPDVAQTRMCVSDQGRQARFVVAAVFSSSAVHWRGKQAAGHCQTGEPQHHQPAIHRAHNPPLAQGAGPVKPSPQRQQRLDDSPCIVLRHVPADDAYSHRHAARSLLEDDTSSAGLRRLSVPACWLLHCVQRCPNRCAPLACLTSPRQLR